MTEPAEFNPLATPAVRLGDKLWPVPPLAPRQFREMFEDMVAVTDALTDALPVSPDAKKGSDIMDRVALLNRPTYDKMLNVVYWGLTRAHPDLTQAEFLDMPIDPQQTVMAFLIVRSQTGFYAAAGEGGTSGEGSGATAP